MLQRSVQKPQHDWSPRADVATVHDPWWVDIDVKKRWGYRYWARLATSDTWTPMVEIAPMDGGEGD